MNNLKFLRLIGVAVTALLFLWAIGKVATSELHGQAGRRPAPRPETISSITLEAGGLTRNAVVHVPPGYDGKTPIPVVLSFHGRNGTGKNQEKLTHFDQVSDRHGFLVVYPDGIGRSWNALHGTGEAEKRGVNDVAFVEALLDHLAKSFAIDNDRIYAAGMSNGGFFAHRLGCELSERIAAIASVAAQMAPALAKVCRPTRPVAVLDIHGTSDRIVPYAGGKTDGGGSLLSAEETGAVWRRLNRCTGDGEETLKKGEVTCRTYQGLYGPC